MTAMKALGIEEAQIKPVLKNLLNLYDKKALADAIFESQEIQATEEKKGKEKKADQAEGSLLLFATKNNSEKVLPEF
ncbi:hypothetical protein YC2023_042572 [Brassica napus]